MLKDHQGQTSGPQRDRRRLLTFDQLVSLFLRGKNQGICVRPRLDDLAPEFRPSVLLGDSFCVVDFSAVASESSSVQGEPVIRLQPGFSCNRARQFIRKSNES